MALSRAELRTLQIIAAGLIAGPGLFLGVALYLRRLGSIAPVAGVEYLAAAYAVSSPFLAGLLRHRLLPDQAGTEPSAEAVRRAVIIPFGVLEGAAFLCGIGLLLGKTDWPLFAAALPLATMAAWFPRSPH